ncbi:MAG: chromate efflux transporter [Synechococcales cyanobacterium]
MSVDTEAQGSLDSLPYEALSPAQRQQRLRDLATVFFRLGATAFGGPAAHISMMDEEVVQRRQWLSREALLDLIGVTQLLPGPNSTELAIHIGFQRAGWPGLWVAGISFILPAMVMVWALAALYVHYQSVPQLQGLLYGIKPVIIALVVQALWKLGRTALKDGPTLVAGCVALVGYFAGIDEIPLLLILGLVVSMVHRWPRPPQEQGALWLPLPGMFAQLGGWSGLIPGLPAWASVFGIFLKIGCVLYGGGYVLLAFLQRDFVDSQLLTSQQLLDAVAIGQFTPGPLFTTATFVGYLVAGSAGAVAGTIGIFLPAFVLVGLVNPWIPALRRSPWTAGFLDGINAASLGLMAAVTYTLGQASLVDGLTLILGIIGVIAVFRWRINSAWLVLAGGVIGLVAQALGMVS